MPFQLGLPEVILVLVVALLFLGPKRLPEAGRSLGRGIREFKDGITGGKDDDEDDAERPALSQSTAQPAPVSPAAAPSEAERQSAEVGSEHRS